jgi:hypothetical protein
MSDEEFEVILSEMKQLRTAITDAVDEIVCQRSEIQALQWLLQRKRIATAQELDAAREEGKRQVDQLLVKKESGAIDAPRVLDRQASPRFCHRGKRSRRVVP